MPDGASADDLVVFDKYARAAEGLGKPSSAARALFEQVLAPAAGPMVGSLLYALANVALIFLVTAELYRRRIFIKL